MPDADDLDVEELRALLRGDAPKPEGGESVKPTPAAAPQATTRLARAGKAATAKPKGAPGKKSKPAARSTKRRSR